MKTEDVDTLIHFHESMIEHSKWLMVPETIYFEEATVKALKELKKLKEEKPNE